jgi:hypothetical protein
MLTPPSHGISTPYSWYFDPLSIVFWPPTIVYRPSYPWYFPLTHGITTHLPMVFWPLTHVILTPYQWYFEPLPMV